MPPCSPSFRCDRNRSRSGVSWLHGRASGLFHMSPMWWAVSRPSLPNKVCYHSALFRGSRCCHDAPPPSFPFPTSPVSSTPTYLWGFLPDNRYFATAAELAGLNNIFAPYVSNISFGSGRLPTGAGDGNGDLECVFKVGRGCPFFAAAVFFVGLAPDNTWQGHSIVRRFPTAPPLHCTDTAACPPHFCLCALFAYVVPGAAGDL